MICNPPSRSLRIALALGALAAAAWPTLAAERIPPAAAPAALRLNELEYLEMPGLNVMLAHDYYPEGHQGGVGIIQKGVRVATNGDLRLDRTPGQWQPVPKVGKRVVDRATGEISLRSEYPDEAKNRKGFNPVDYPDLRFAYTVRVRPEGKAFRILVDLEQPLPDEWTSRVGFNMELFPGILFGKTFATETQSGIFPRQANGPGNLDAKGEYQIAPPANGKRLVIAPESDRQRMVIEDVKGGGLELVDGRGQHNNGWFVVRSLVPKGATKGAVESLVTPHAIPGFTSAPTVQVSQVGYHPKQQKWAIVETDPRDTRRLPVVVSRITGTGALEKAMEATEALGPLPPLRGAAGPRRRGPTAPRPAGAGRAAGMATASMRRAVGTATSRRLRCLGIWR
jgi:endoglucanase